MHTDTQRNAMELEDEEEVSEPVSPTGQYFNSSAISLSILAVLETEVPIDDLKTMSLLREVFLPINPRFSSIMVMDENGENRWKRVEVKLRDHVYVPIFPARMSPQFYDKYLEEYLSKLAMEQLPQSQPLWEVHLINYPTSNAAGIVIFKIHHALGDGYSLMGALLSCLQRADDPSLPLTFPSVQPRVDTYGTIFKRLPKILSLLFNTASDFWWSLMKSSLIEDDVIPIRSGDMGIEFRPISVTTMAFSLGHIKQIKASLGVTINDVITGVIFLGTRLYMQEMSKGSSNQANTTAIVLLNTRMTRTLRSVKEMVKPNAVAPWGNHFAFLHVSLPELMDTTAAAEVNPIEFVKKAQKIIKKKRSSLAVYLTAACLDILKKFKGPEVAAQFIHKTLMNTSIAITNMIGPLEKMSLDNHPIKGMYFAIGGNPQSLTVTIVSYMDKLRITLEAEKGFIDAQKLKSCIDEAFQMILKSTVSAFN